MRDQNHAVIPHFLTVVPKPSLFIGRENLLTSIEDALSQERNVVLIHGIGGIGKTTVALAYAHDVRYGSQYGHIAFFEITTDIESALASNRRLQQYLGIAEIVAQLPPEQYYLEGARRTLDALAKIPDKTLLIFDNVNNRDDLLHWKTVFKSLPVNTLFTSRARIDGLAVVEVEPLSANECITLFLHYYGKPRGNLLANDLSALAELLIDIEHHTLLIEMLASIAREAKYSPAHLRDFLQSGFIRHCDLQRTVSTGDHGEAHGKPEAKVNEYVRFLFADVLYMSDEEKKILCYLAVLPPKNYSPDDLLKLFQISDKDRTILFDLLAIIYKKGVPVEKDGSYLIHPLVRETVLQGLKPTTLVCLPVIKTITNLLYFDETKDNPIDKFPLVEFGLSLLHNVKWSLEIEISELMNRVAIVLSHLGKYMVSAQWCEKALTIALQNFDNDHQIVTTQKNDLAEIYWQLGKYDEARRLLEEALSSDLKNFGEDHPIVATRRSNLGSVHRAIGNYEIAQTLLEKALASDLNNFGEEHPNTARCQNNLAFVLKDLGEYKRARDLLEQALASYLKNFGENHPNIALCRTSLANMYRALGEHDRARDLFEDALASDLKNFGESHPNVANRQSNLALVFLEMGHYQEALIFFNRGLKNMIAALGEEHPKVIKLKQAFVDILRQGAGTGNKEMQRLLSEIEKRDTE